jgi:hypothetical protein
VLALHLARVETGHRGPDAFRQRLVVRHRIRPSPQCPAGVSARIVQLVTGRRGV